MYEKERQLSTVSLLDLSIYSLHVVMTRVPQQSFEIVIMLHLVRLPSILEILRS